MKTLILILILLAQSVAFAGEEIPLPGGASYCITEMESAEDFASIASFQNYVLYGRHNRPGSLYMYNASWTCQERSAWMDGLDVIQISMEATSVVGLVCAPATGGSSLSLSLFTGVGSIVLSMAKLVIRNVPCEDRHNQRSVEEAVKRTICQIAGQSGGTCDMEKIIIEYKEDVPYTRIDDV